jgi:hypothetical protein
MSDDRHTTRLTPLSSETPSHPFVPPAAVRPAGYAAPAQFLEMAHPEDLAMLSQLAAQLLQDPLAVQQLGDRVVELLQRDLGLQRERSHGYGRR